ncbi:DUF3618 domain-containing protein [Thermocatellispora tengchongensis]|uniref:DUF3618 domain-containing protein n=1 Tax=Thermocatellispora tengchongensis TaxID=1073253 RepID=UPI0036321A98
MADTDPDELERRIERTRAELARTVDAIADRVSPKRVAQRGSRGCGRTRSRSSPR